MNAYRDLSDRYGADDPIVVQLREDLARRRRQVDTLPFGERRKANLAPHLWGRRMRPETRMHRERPTP